MGSRQQMTVFALLIVLAAFGVSLWQYAGLVKKEQQDNSRVMAERQALITRQLAQHHNRLLQEHLELTIAREQTVRNQVAGSDEQAQRLFLETEFLAVALLKFDGQSTWQPAWTRERRSVTERWKTDFIRGLVAELPVAQVKSGNLIWYRTTDPQAQPLFAALSEIQLNGQKHIAVGLLPSSIFSSVVEALRGTTTEAVVLDERGYALAFTEQQYVGSNVEAHPTVGQMMKRRDVLTNAVVPGRSGENVSAVLARVDGSNLYVMTAVPLNSGWALLSQLGFGHLLLLLAMCVIAGTGMFYLSARTESVIEYLKLQLTHIAEGEPVRYPQSSISIPDLLPSIEKLVSKDHAAPAYIVAATEQRVDSGKMDAYKEISVGLSQALRDPLASILAQAQIARAKAGNDEFKQHFVVIEREARRARDTVEHLTKITGEENFPHNLVDVQDVLLAALSNLKGEISSQSIKVHKELSSASIQANSVQLQTALEEILRNSIEALAQVPVEQRSLTLRTQTNDGRPEIEIQDQGPGIEDSNLAKVFDPFFTTKTGPDHKGLGLTVAKGIIKGFGGHIRFTAGAGSGCTVVIDLPGVGATVNRTEAERPKSENGALKTNGLGLPLIGSHADELPTAPAHDELTFTSISADGEIPVRPPKVEEPS